MSFRRPQDPHGAIARLLDVHVAILVNCHPGRTSEFRAERRTSVTGIAYGASTRNGPDGPIGRDFENPFRAAAEIPIRVGFREKGVTDAIHSNTAGRSGSGKRDLMNESVRTDLTRAVVTVRDKQIAHRI